MAQSETHLDEILYKALKIESEADRAEYLNEACGSDVDLRARVEKLLGAYPEAGSFLDSPAVLLNATIDQPITEKPGTQIGPYKLLQQIGEGGMGVVYMAEQKQPMKRRVALKIIKPGMDTRQVIARFEAERQALAMMDHPNIAKVLDAGQTESGRPYFVMELVNGISVAKYCDEQHLNPKERLELFVNICQAVQHAHQKGIIHRDLKPSNVLVALYDGKAVPKVIDFGVAKATNQSLTDKTMFTQLGQIVGTLEYMSPEQAQWNQLDVDTRSDIYSLGVILYELLSGETPFDSKNLRSAALEEMLRIIREDEPSKPSTKVSSSESLPSIAANRRIDPQKLGATIRGELDWIVMKALEKDRGRRYETASKFAEDVQHYLNDEAVEACPPSRAYKFRKFARRNKTKLATGSLIAASLLLIVGSVGWVVRDRTAQRAEVARENTRRQDRVTTQVELLMADVDRLTQENQWDEALAMGRRAEVALASGDADARVKETVRVVLRELEFVARLEEIRMKRAVWTDDGFDNAGAVTSYAEAFREFRVDLASSKVAVAQLKQHPRISVPVVVALDDFVAAYRKMGESEESGNHWRSLVETAQGLDSDPLRTELRSIWGSRVTPETQTRLRRLAAAFHANVQGPQTALVLGDTLWRGALTELEEQILRSAQQAFPGDYWLNLELGAVLVRNVQHAEAVRFLSAALAAQPDSTAALNNLGHALEGQGKLAEAITCFRDVIELDPEFLFAHYNLGNTLFTLGKDEEAIAAYRRSIEIKPSFAEAHCHLGRSLRRQGKLNEANDAYRRSIELEPDLPAPHFNLGNLLSQIGKPEEAIKEYRIAIRLDPNDANAHGALGRALSKLGQSEQGVAELRRSVEIRPDGDYYNSLAAALGRLERVDEAIVEYRHAVELGDTNAHFNLAQHLMADQERLDEAIELLRGGLESMPEFVEGRVWLGNTLVRQGKLQEALAEFQKACELKPDFAKAHYGAARTLWLLERRQEAIEELGRVFEPDSDGRLPEAFAAPLPNIALHLALGDVVNREFAVAITDELTRAFPKDEECWYARGVARYQTEDWEDAIASLMKSQPSATAEFYLAISHHQLGNISEARKYYEQAVARNKDVDESSSEDVRELQAKAAVLFQDGQNEP